MKSRLLKRYSELYGETRGKELLFVRSPGRVNYLGAHTDYSGGLALPAAIDLAVYVAGSMRDDNLARVHSVAFGETVEFSIDEFSRDSYQSWANFPKAVVYEFKRRFGSVPGFQIVIGSDLPVASGLSSSAALEVALAVFLQQVTGISIDPLECAQLCKDAENNYIGMQCGIMDQMTALLGKKNSVLFIDCGFLKYSHIPLPPEKISTVVVNTGIKRQLTGTQFNVRREAVEKAMRFFSEKDPAVEFSSQITFELFNRYRQALSEEARPLMEHIVHENRRVRDGVNALKKRDYERFGGLMTESYRSSRDLFRVTIPELDFIADFAESTAGALGAKLMGGGFGGAVAVLTSPDAGTDFAFRISEAYEHRLNKKPDILFCNPAQGVSVSTIPNNS